MKLSVDQAVKQGYAHAKRGEVAQARALFQSVLDDFPKHRRAQMGLAALAQPPKAHTAELPQADYSKLVAHYTARDFAAVIADGAAPAADYPDAPLLHNLLGAAHRSLGQMVQAEAAFERAAALNPDLPDAHNNLGVVRNKLGKSAEAITALQTAIALRPDNANAHLNLGLALQKTEAYADAVDAFAQAVRLAPGTVQAHFNMGASLQRLGDLDAAIDAYKRADALSGGYPDAWFNIGAILQKQGDLDAAVAAFETAVAKGTAHAGDAYLNIGAIRTNQRQFTAAMAACQQALALRRDKADVHNNMGRIHYAKGEIGKARAAYQKVLRLNPDHVQAHNNLAVVLNDLGEVAQSLAMYDRALELSSDYPVAEEQMLRKRQTICAFGIWDRLPEAAARLGITTSAVSPFSKLAFVDDPDVQLKTSQGFARAKYTEPTQQIPSPPVRRPKKIKVGYFSADFYNHATMFLIAGLLRHHNRDDFELYGYCFGSTKPGPWRDTAIGLFDHFIEVADKTDPEIAQLAQAQGLDIAIDLKGYTRNTRTGIFQHRPAPVQVSYLGYPGSLGVDFMDYIVADPVVIPPQEAQYYAEQVIYLPHSYQPNDSARQIADVPSQRSDFGLPDTGFVFCCFNSTYKISPVEFAIWMRLLRQVEGSVLWLYRSNAEAEQNLKREAQAQGIDPGRLIFAELIPHEEHLARHRHADLFMDTFIVNAHTTASDALWAGVPVVTKPGRQFAARVAASLLQAVGLPELVVHSDADYEALILALAQDPARLGELKAKLSALRQTAPLFDTARYTRNFEQGLMAAYDRYFHGQPAQDIWVQDDGL